MKGQTHVNREIVAVQELSVPVLGLGGPANGLRIAHVSDFHFRRWNGVLAEAQRLLLALDYDLLVATGDFSARTKDWVRAAEMCRRFFGPLQPRLGTYAVLGNHDSRTLGDQPDLPFKWLTNEHVRVAVDDACLILAGVDQSIGEPGKVSEALIGPPAAAPVILLAHFPSTVYRVPVDRVRLVLSGHTHGGQIRLPLLGCVWANDRIPSLMARGLHQIAGTMLHVSAGLGVSLPIPLRYRCPPELSIIRLECAEPDAAGASNGSESAVNTRKLRPRRGLAARV